MGAETFWARVDRSGNCWLWRGACTHNGYGHLTVGKWFDGRKRQMRAHRLAFMLTHGHVADGRLVLHACDNRRCCNPDHLRVGSAADNSADMISRGRGKIAPRAKLTKGQVRAIRSDPRSAKDVAIEYGVGRRQIYYIRSGQQWQTAL